MRFTTEIEEPSRHMAHGSWWTIPGAGATGGIAAGTQRGRIAVVAIACEFITATAGVSLSNVAIALVTRRGQSVQPCPWSPSTCSKAAAADGTQDTSHTVWEHQPRHTSREIQSTALPYQPRATSKVSFLRSAFSEARNTETTVTETMHLNMAHPVFIYHARNHVYFEDGSSARLSGRTVIQTNRPVQAGCQQIWTSR